MTYDTIDDGESMPLLQEGGSSVDGTSTNGTNKKGPRYSQRCKTLLGIIIAAVATTTAAVAFLTYPSSSAVGGNPIVSTLSSLLGTGRKRGESCYDIWWNACGPGLSCFKGGNSNYCVPNGKENACCGYFDDGGDARGIDCEGGLICENTYNGVPDCGTTICVRGRYKHTRFAREGSCKVNDGEPATEFVNYDCESIL